MPRLLLGQSDFEQFRADDGFYLDKSLFIQNLLNAAAPSQLYPRPRRFGKTLNLSLARYFFEIGPDRSELFSDLAIWQVPEARRHFQRHPVINLTFKGIKTTTWAETLLLLQHTLATEIRRLLPTLGHAAYWTQLADQPGQIPPTILAPLSQTLHQRAGEKVVILIDEYDAPLLTAWQHDETSPGYYDALTGWLRSLLEAALKDNASLFRGVLTGVLRVAKESMFSGLNNLQSFSLLSTEQPEQFGFTEADIDRLLDFTQRTHEKPDFQQWYNGYRFGETTIYNPWSILCALTHPRSPLQAWWVNSSENTLLRTLLIGESAFRNDFARLLAGETVEKEIDESIILRELHGSSVWSLFLLAGYLRAESIQAGTGAPLVTLRVPNQEVMQLWKKTFMDWISGKGTLEPLHEALLSGDAPAVQELLERLLERHVSSHDVKASQDEAFYHAFVLGLLVSLEKTHLVHSNREVGRGRADVQIAPKELGKPGVILEFKKLERGRTLAGMAEEALAQTVRLKYTTELENRGVSPIYCFGISFSGKEVVVRGGAERLGS